MHCAVLLERLIVSGFPVDNSIDCRLNNSDTPPIPSDHQAYICTYLPIPLLCNIGVSITLIISHTRPHPWYMSSEQNVPSHPHQSHPQPTQTCFFKEIIGILLS